MADQETIRLVMEVVGEEEVKRLTSAVDKQRASVLELAKTYGVHDARVMQSAQTLRGLKTQLDSLERSAGQATNKMAGMGQSLLQGGRALQDFSQGGFLGVINNIEGVVMALGGTAGLAGILTAVGVAAMVATPYIKEFFATLGNDGPKRFATEIDKVRDKLKTIEEKDTKVDFDFREIDRLKAEIERLTRGKQFLDRILSKKTEAQQESERQVEEILGAPGGQAAVKRATAAFVGQETRNQPEVIKAEERRNRLVKDEIAVREALKNATRPGEAVALSNELVRAEKARIAAEEDYLTAVRNAGQKLEAEFGATAGDVKGQARLAEWLKAVGAGDIAAKVEGAAPDKVETPTAKRAREKREEETEQLSAQGLANEATAQRDKAAAHEADLKALGTVAESRARLAEQVEKQARAEARKADRAAAGGRAGGGGAGGVVAPGGGPIGPEGAVGPEGEAGGVPMVSPLERAAFQHQSLMGRSAARATAALEMHRRRAANAGLVPLTGPIRPGRKKDETAFGGLGGFGEASTMVGGERLDVGEQAPLEALPGAERARRGIEDRRAMEARNAARNEARNARILEQFQGAGAIGTPFAALGSIGGAAAGGAGEKVAETNEKVAKSLDGLKQSLDTALRDGLKTRPILAR
jgi:hypothetical protein